MGCGQNRSTLLYLVHSHLSLKRMGVGLECEAQLADGFQ
jgi:hypothetical protein